MVGADNYLIHCRLSPHVKTSRLVVVQMLISSLDKAGNISNIDGTGLREIPIARIEALANSGEFRELIGRRLDEDVVLNFNKQGFQEARTPSRRSLRLKVPESRPFPDDFYERLATAYVAAVHLGGASPVTEIAKANGVPEDRVHSWVKGARKKGLLGPGQRGG